MALNSVTATNTAATPITQSRWKSHPVSSIYDHHTSLSGSLVSTTSTNSQLLSISTTFTTILLTNSTNSNLTSANGTTGLTDNEKARHKNPNTLAIVLGVILGIIVLVLIPLFYYVGNMRRKARESSRQRAFSRSSSPSTKHEVSQISSEPHNKDQGPRKDSHMVGKIIFGGSVIAGLAYLFHDHEGSKRREIHANSRRRNPLKPGRKELYDSSTPIRAPRSSTRYKARQPTTSQSPTPSSSSPSSSRQPARPSGFVPRSRSSPPAATRIYNSTPPATTFTPHDIYITVHPPPRPTVRQTSHLQPHSRPSATPDALSQKTFRLDSKKFLAHQTFTQNSRSSSPRSHGAGISHKSGESLKGHSEDAASHHRSSYSHSVPSTPYTPRVTVADSDAAEQSPRKSTSQGHSDIVPEPSPPSKYTTFDSGCSKDMLNTHECHDSLDARSVPDRYQWHDEHDVYEKRERNGRLKTERAYHVDQDPSDYRSDRSVGDDFGVRYISVVNDRSGQRKDNTDPGSFYDGSYNYGSNDRHDRLFDSDGHDRRGRQAFDFRKIPDTPCSRQQTDHRNLDNERYRPSLEGKGPSRPRNTVLAHDNNSNSTLSDSTFANYLNPRRNNANHYGQRHRTFDATR